MPDPAWSGYAAVDFEDWTPVWEENTNPSGWHGKRYQDFSIELVQAAQPSLSLAEATAKAKEEFEAAALGWMVGVLERLKELRPQMKVGFYGIPNQLYCETNWHPCTPLCLLHVCAEPSLKGGRNAGQGTARAATMSAAPRRRACGESRPSRPDHLRKKLAETFAQAAFKGCSRAL